MPVTFTTNTTYGLERCWWRHRWNREQKSFATSTTDYDINTLGIGRTQPNWQHRFWLLRSRKWWYVTYTLYQGPVRDLCVMGIVILDQGGHFLSSNSSSNGVVFRVLKTFVIIIKLIPCRYSFYSAMLEKKALKCFESYDTWKPIPTYLDKCSSCLLDFILELKKLSR